LLRINGKPLSALRVTVMGLGLHGGGTASALFFARHGARVTVTDLRSRRVLTPSLRELRGYNVRYVLGGHHEDDFINTDLVIKNPGVPPDSSFLRVARANGVAVETDISVFLRLCSNPLIAVTGSKGKSTTVSALFHCLRRFKPDARLGGNITVSPLLFLEELTPTAPVVLELSSWQLADLKGNTYFKPKISIITNILPDHMNRYADMEQYVADKKIIYANQDRKDFSVFNYDDAYSPVFKRESRAQAAFFSAGPLPAGIGGAWLEHDRGYVNSGGDKIQILDEKLSVPGTHNRLNLLCAGLALYLFGLEPEGIRSCLTEFPGIEHRLEQFHTKNGVRFYNDSASTIPQAVAAAMGSITGPLVLITGGTDKNIDFTPLKEIACIPRAIVLLAGSATKKIISLLENEGVSYLGPFKNLKKAVVCAYRAALPGSAVVFSPGCASFGMFLNEFDRGRKYKRIVKRL
jgi:UDP-N-acetylmuramoylalanine--D-glutamate ligase